MAEWLNAAVSKTVSRIFRDGGSNPPLSASIRLAMKSLFILLLVSTIALSQSENWILVSSEEDKNIYINSTGLNIYQEGDIQVWVKEEYNDPIRMEEIEEKIYFVKSYYVINRELLKYSLIEVIYYDEEKNVLKSYRYNRNYEDPQYKYSSPIIKNSDMEKIFSKCEELIKKASVQ